MMGGKNNMSLVKVEAYAMASSTYVKNDSHCFVITEDKKNCWKNHGGGWDDSREKKKVAENMAYKEWLWEFVPPNNPDKCGIQFGVNGVCHTYANRELLIGENEANAERADKDYVCVFFFGKYGLGQKQLKQLLTDSYNKVMNSYNDPYHALGKVLDRVDHTIDDELQAWRKTGIEYAQIPVDDILNKNYQGGLAVARSRMKALIEKREAIYENYQEGRVSDLRGSIKALIQTEADSYLNMLAGIHYITERERQQYSGNISRFLGQFSEVLRAQQETYQKTGRIVQDFHTLGNLEV